MKLHTDSLKMKNSIFIFKFYLEGLRDVFTFHLHALSHQLQTALVVVHLEEEEEEDEEEEEEEEEGEEEEGS